MSIASFARASRENSPKSVCLDQWIHWNKTEIIARSLPAKGSLCHILLRDIERTLVNNAYVTERVRSDAEEVES
jgi:hypothetical protein